MINRPPLRALTWPVLVAALAALLAAAPQIAGLAMAAQTPAGIDAAKLSHHVKVISGDDYEGRGPATRA
jgi:hypothetical protein